jgi:hypothetical protein
MPIKDEAARKAYHKAYSAIWNKENKHKVAIYKKKYRASRPKEWAILEERKKTLRRYNLTLELYDEKLKSQDYKCAICGIHQNDNTKNGKSIYLSVDHCHKSNKVRDLLCHKCNTGLGYFKDNTEFLLKAVDYLRKHVL